MKDKMNNRQKMIAATKARDSEINAGFARAFNCLAHHDARLDRELQQLETGDYRKPS